MLRKAGIWRKQRTLTTGASRRRLGAGLFVVILVGAAGSAPTVGGELARVVAIANEVKDGFAEPGWKGGDVPYSWGGGHGPDPGPSHGTCKGYHGAIKPCAAEATLGLDCSGLTRWVYRLAFGRDVLGGGNTNDHIPRLRRVAPGDALPGDLVFYGEVTAKKVKTHHVGIYLGDGQMINALRTGTKVRVDQLTAMKDFAGYFHYDG
jgi:cell wall-associated NlpC family hydrolase